MRTVLDAPAFLKLLREVKIAKSTNQGRIKKHSNKGKFHNADF